MTLFDCTSYECSLEAKQMCTKIRHCQKISYALDKTVVYPRCPQTPFLERFYLGACILIPGVEI